MTPVFFVLSLPAKSTRLSLLVSARSSPSPSMRTCTWMVKTVCEREDVLFRAWPAVDRLASPAGQPHCLHQSLKLLHVFCLMLICRGQMLQSQHHIGVHAITRILSNSIALQQGSAKLPGWSIMSRWRWIHAHRK